MLIIGKDPNGIFKHIINFKMPQSRIWFIKNKMLIQEVTYCQFSQLHRGLANQICNTEIFKSDYYIFSAYGNS